jgi:molybdate transport system substrate-binding protein
MLPRALLLLLFTALPLRAEIVVSASATLEGALTQIAILWEERGGEKVRLNLGASRSLALQIVAGAPADVFITANEPDADWLAARGLLLPDSRRPVAMNRLAVIVPRRSSTEIRSARDLASPAVRRIALADPEAATAGIHGKRFLQRAGVWTAVETRVIPGADVRSALAMVASGAADAGIVFRTDALSNPAVRIAFEPSAAPIPCTAALVRRRSPHSGAAAFLEFLTSPPAVEIFGARGFGPAAQRPGRGAGPDSDGRSPAP